MCWRDHIPQVPPFHSCYGICDRNKARNKHDSRYFPSCVVTRRCAIVSAGSVFWSPADSCIIGSVITLTMLAPPVNREKERESWDPGANSDSIFAQLERILGSGLFQHSKRYPNFLQYVVEHTLKGEAGQLKERTLGVAVFHRSPEYDTSADPVVRNTATEVRKRLESYYGQPGRESELRISLPVGSYVPEFGASGRHTLEPVETAPILDVRGPSAARRGKPARRLWLAGLFGAACLTLIAGFYLLRAKPAVERFWAPVLQNKESVLVVMGPLRGIPEPRILSASGVPVVTNQVDPRLYLLVTETHIKFASFLLMRGRKPEFALASETTASRLRKAPFILLGGYNNDWTLRSTGNFRYYLQLDAEHSMRHIRDRQNSAAGWHVPISPTVTDDYALIVRAVDQLTGQPMLAIAGAGEKGGAAAIEFLTDPKYLEAFARTAPAGWEKRNIELVIQTKLVDEDWAAPRLVASHLW